MHICTIIRRSLRNINIIGAKLDFDLGVQAKATIRQILIHLLLITEPGGFWIKSITILVRWEALFPLSSVVAFPLLKPLDELDSSPFFIATKMRKTIEI